MSRSPALLVAALTGLTFTVTPTAAQATTTIDCSAGPVVITSSTEDYVLTGVCSDVTVDASNVTVGLPGAARLTISGANVDVASTGPLGALTLTDAVSEVTAPRAGSAKVLSSNVTLRIATIGSLQVTGANNIVKATRGDTAKVRGSNNRLTYTRLKRLVIRGANNRARVRQGRTAVTVRGANNVVRVHKRSRTSS